MDKREFKSIFSDTAKSNGFLYAHQGWFKESEECIITLMLQKSQYRNYYQLNINCYIKGIFGIDDSINARLFKNATGHFSSNETREYKKYFDLDSLISENSLKFGLDQLFKHHVVPFTDKALTINGIKELKKDGSIFLLPNIEEAMIKQKIK